MATTARAQLEKALRWIEENWVGQKECAICGNSGWFMGEVVGEMKQMNSKSKWIPNTGPSYPMIVLSCENCGYTLLFNAIVLGVVEG
ncbi:MAG: hypothetical protein OXI91_16540 [Chloroflexota bacterium]|nr:hypothetical protein [Chloroflexota bacterium]